MSAQRLVIATRASRLALWQAGHVKERLEQLHPGTRVDLLPLTTSGDQLLDRRLDQAGGKGLFVKELESAMAEGRADLAVHSMKDVPADLPPGFTLAAITAREDPRDAFLSNRYRALADMPPRAVVGTSSLRRAAQVSERYPQLEIRLLRGNVETRIAKLDRGEYDAIVLAVAGLLRLGLAERISSRLAIDESLPAPGQGALGIECRGARGDVLALLAPLADVGTAQCVYAERAVSRALGGSCALPLGAYAVMAAGRIELQALVASADGRRVLRAHAAGTDPEEVGARAAHSLRAQGADAILPRVP
ncbi:MAG TPA: hydroxymethylbilane synthase [Burkholderiales bacterium]|jgi:hydroxymethylbilane synthase|nr:hydroxymethylbilane synthase [Burkholderiales bacterium]